MGTVTKTSAWPILLLTFVTLFSYAKAQNSLQVEFEKGFPLSEDYLSERHQKSKIIKPKDDQSLEWRLPRVVVPIEYDLKITPIIDETYNGTLGNLWDAPGEVTIKVNVTAATSTITLHSLNITIHNLTVSEDQTAVFSNCAHSLAANHSFLIINCDQPLPSNIYKIHVTFTSIVKKGLDGLYRSNYSDPISNQTKWIATTQMEALHARQMFPCFDEPAFKAKFYITIGRQEKYIALATTASQRNESMSGHPGWVWEHFQPTVIMPTYLIAVIVSEFKYEQAPGNVLIGKTVRTYAPQHYIDLQGGVYASEKAEIYLQYFQTYFDHQYPLSKMDSAAVPDFYFGAMENYGLNIYRESALLYFPEESTEAERWRITSILGHELAHQWFGNLVSPRWWTHIWLNEGFATYLAAQGANEIAPEFQPWERFVNDAVQYSMGFDARPDYSHSVKIDENEWITKWAMDWFDRMAYEKAGSLIRMMNGFLTEPVLKAALIKYLHGLEFNAAIQDDLFAYLHEEAQNNSKIPADLTMKDIMDTWTLQPGFPLLRVSVASPNTVYISQERFINNEALGQIINQDTGLWYVPMEIASKSEPTPSSVEWIYKTTAVKVMPANTAEWIIVNNGANGFYRVLYDAPLTQLIKQELETNHTFINSVTRSQLLDDYFSAAWQKYGNIETALSLATYLGNEQEIVVWNAVFNNLRKPFNLLSSSGSFYSTLRNFLLPRVKSATVLTGGIEANFPVKGGMPVIRHLQFLDWLCAFEDPDCIAYSTKFIDEWRSQPSEWTNNTVPRDIKPVVYCTAVANGNDDTFYFIQGRYRQAGITVKQQGTLLNALACTKDVSIVNVLLEGALQDGFYLDNAHVTTIMQRLAMNTLARGPMLRWLRGNTQKVIDRLTIEPIVSAITTLSTYISTASELQDLNAYLNENPDIGNAEPIAGALDTINQNIKWVADFAGDMSNFLTSA